MEKAVGSILGLAMTADGCIASTLAAEAHGVKAAALNTLEHASRYRSWKEKIMPQTSSRLFDELAKLMSNAAGAAQGVRREIDTLVKAQVERVLNDAGVVRREEFEVVRGMAQRAREENERLLQRIAELEARLPPFPETMTH